MQNQLQNAQTALIEATANNKLDTAKLQTAFIGYAENAGVPQPRGLVADAILAITTNADAQKCTADSLLGAFMATATMNLSLNPTLGLAYIIPRNKKIVVDKVERWVKVATLQISYKGFLAMLYRANPDFLISCEVVVKGEVCTIDNGTTPKISHIINIERDTAFDNIVGAYGVVKNRHTGVHLTTVYLTKAELEKLRLANPDQNKDKPTNAWAWYKSMSFAKIAKQICKLLAMNDVLAIDESMIQVDANGSLDVTTENELTRANIIDGMIEQITAIAAEKDIHTEKLLKMIEALKTSFIEKFGANAWANSSVQKKCLELYRAQQAKEQSNTIKI